MTIFLPQIWRYQPKSFFIRLIKRISGSCSINFFPTQIFLFFWIFNFLVFFCVKKGLFSKCKKNFLEYCNSDGTRSRYSFYHSNEKRIRVIPLTLLKKSCQNERPLFGQKNSQKYILSRSKYQFTLYLTTTWWNTIKDTSHAKILLRLNEKWIFEIFFKKSYHQLRVL